MRQNIRVLPCLSRSRDRVGASSRKPFVPIETELESAVTDNQPMRRYEEAGVICAR